MDLSQTRRAAIISGFAFALAGAATAQTSPPGARFTPAAFDAAQAAGKSIVVEVTAPWCPTCKAQAPIVKSLMDKPDMKGVMLLTVDFDSQKDVVQKLGVRQQSTLIAFKGKAETARSTGDTTPAGIEKLFRSAI
jgi:thiol-disulfide isomerase/thioredoxin